MDWKGEPWQGEVWQAKARHGMGCKQPQASSDGCLGKGATNKLKEVRMSIPINECPYGHGPLDPIQHAGKTDLYWGIQETIPTKRGDTVTAVELGSRGIMVRASECRICGHVGLFMPKHQYSAELLKA